MPLIVAETCVHRSYVVANAFTVVMMTLFIPYEALVEVGTA